MATFALIHGAGDAGWYWHLVESVLRQRGHDVVAPDLPCDDDAVTLLDYADTVVEAIGGRRNLTVVAQSYGGFTAPLVADRLPVEVVVFYHDVPPAPAEEALRKERSESDTAYHSSWPLDSLPAVPTKFVVCTEDRFFPAPFMRRMAAERLGVVPDEIAAGRCVALSHPDHLGNLLDGYTRPPVS